MDLYHYWGGDLVASPVGDLATIDGITLGVQRVLRRILTAPGEYIWHPNYGAGLPQKIGQTADLRVLRAIIRSQIFKERAVSRTPPPQITVSATATGAYTITIVYTDAFAQKTVTVSFPVTAQPFSQSQQSGISLEVPN